MNLIAHRGYSNLAPENTISSFDLAISNGFKIFEFDLHLARQEAWKEITTTLRKNQYKVVISFESVYHPGNGNFENDFRKCLGKFKSLCGEV